MLTRAIHALLPLPASRVSKDHPLPQVHGEALHGCGGLGLVHVPVGDLSSLHASFATIPQEAVSSRALLRPNLQFIEVVGYTWTDHAAVVCITISVPEPVPKEQVSSHLCRFASAFDASLQPHLHTQHTQEACGCLHMHRCLPTLGKRVWRCGQWASIGHIACTCLCCTAASPQTCAE